MRTTLDLPDALLKRAKIEAVERGISLKELVGTSQATAWLEREAEESRILLCRVVQMGVHRLLTNAP
jgi:hypothetical protein